MVEEEIGRLRNHWSHSEDTGESSRVEELLGAEAAEQLDRFDRVQLEDVISVCRTKPTLSAAGRVLFAQSRSQKRVANDADRLRKYLAKFNLSWNDLH